MKKAIEKLNDEMENNKASYVQAVGGFLLQHLEEDATAADKILEEGKTIAGSLEEMRKEAEKQKVGNVAVLSDEDGFAAVLKYYGIGEEVSLADTFDFLN